jgi:YceI-like domain
MHRFDASSAECLVFTFKEGLLSAVAHNLKIRVTKFVIEVAERTRAIEARFDAGSLRVVCAMEDGAEAPRTLTKDNKREIEGNIVRDVLHSATYPEIRFASSAVAGKRGAYVVKGALFLHGRQRRITVAVREESGCYVAETKLHQPDFGIRPYSALLGTLKVKADVTVRVEVPIPRS